MADVTNNIGSLGGMYVFLRNRYVGYGCEVVIADFKVFTVLMKEIRVRMGLVHMVLPGHRREACFQGCGMIQGGVRQRR